MKGFWTAKHLLATKQTSLNEGRRLPKSDYDLTLQLSIPLKEEGLRSKQGLQFETSIQKVLDYLNMRCLQKEKIDVKEFFGIDRLLAKWRLPSECLSSSRTDSSLMGLPVF